MRWLTITERFTIIGMYNEGQNMRKALCGFLSILAVFGVVCFFSGQSHDHKKQFAVISCVSERTAASAANAAVVRGMEDMRMQVVYQLAKRSVVKLIVKDAAASGIIWKIEDGIVIVSSRHLLMKDVKAQVVFGNGETFAAEVAGYSQQYDIGFARIPEESVTNSVLREIYEAVPVLYEAETESAKAEFGQKYLEKRVLQLGEACFSTGSIKALTYMPLFNTTVLETACFSKAGMSGGGVFGEDGMLLGMISGGAVPEGATEREAEITYSIPPVLIAAEYEKLAKDD